MFVALNDGPSDLSGIASMGPGHVSIKIDLPIGGINSEFSNSLNDNKYVCKKIISKQSDP
jgi:hypothetical protein